MDLHHDITTSHIHAASTLWVCPLATPTTISALGISLLGAVPARTHDLEVVLRVVGGQELARVRLPAFPAPLAEHTATGTRPVPLDVGQEHLATCRPAAHLPAGTTVECIAITAEEPPPGGIHLRLQLGDDLRLAELPQPFFAQRGAGPVCRLPWSDAEVICTGTGIPHDVRCAPQNNSGVVHDDDGTRWQFTSFYSIDEQFGADGRDGGNHRIGNVARILAFRSAPGEKWVDTGVLVDPISLGLTYAGDPFAFRDLHGRPCLVYSTVDGTNGFSDWEHIDAWIMRSQSASFAGPWEAPTALLRRLPGHHHADRAICWRVFPRRSQGDYLLAWSHGERDISVRGLLVTDLNQTLTHDEVLSAPILARNQEEGGGGFVVDEVAYLSTWQIPGINDPTGIQRLYAIDLKQPLAAGACRALPGSWG